MKYFIWQCTCTLEVFEVFADISDDLALDKESFEALQMRAAALQASCTMQCYIFR